MYKKWNIDTIQGEWCTSTNDYIKVEGDNVYLNGELYGSLSCTDKFMKFNNWKAKREHIDYTIVWEQYNRIKIE